VICFTLLPFTFEYTESLPRHRTFPAFIISSAHGEYMDNADYCRRQAQECRRLLRLPQSAAQAQALKNLCHSWVRLANQTDLYAQVVKRERGSEKIDAVPIRDFAFRQRVADLDHRDQS
jgi:hypothetical protein